MQLPYLSYIEWNAKEGITTLTTAYAIGTKTAIFPSKGVHATCIDCGEEVVSKCGTIVSHHFAHKSNSNCGSQFHDHKSEWHQAWQHTIVPALPGENVEVTIKSDACVKRADMVSHAKYIIEFQHSPLSLPERLEREAHYKNLIWVVHDDRIKSRTWKHRNGYRVFFNGDGNTVHWKSNFQYVGKYPLNCSLSKSDFIQKVVNNQFYCESVFVKIESRQLKQERRRRERELQEFDKYNYAVWNRQPESSLYTATLYMATLVHDLENYHEMIETERKAIKKRIEEESELKRKEQRIIRDPSLLQCLIRAELDIETDALERERSAWIATAEQIYYEANKARIEKEKAAKKEIDDLILKRANEEIINSITKRLDVETQERVRIDILRVKGRNAYAAESARKRLALLNIYIEGSGNT